MDDALQVQIGKDNSHDDRELVGCAKHAGMPMLHSHEDKESYLLYFCRRVSGWMAFSSESQE